MPFTPDLDAQAAQSRPAIDLGVAGVYVHNVERNQTEFIKACGQKVVPQLRWRS